MKPLKFISAGFVILIFGAALWTLFLDSSNERGSGASAQILNNADSAERMRGQFTLAISWQPAFCEGAGRRPECRAQDQASTEATQFSLHGLWPEPRDAVYCNVPGQIIRNDKNGQWRDLPTVELTDRVWDSLRVAMPGTQSMLHRHEWIKHGTCANVSPTAYYSASLKLLDKINASEVTDLMVRNIGGELSAKQIQAAFDKAFGRGAGRRVTVECAREGGRTMIGELRISLKGEIGNAPDLATLISAAPERSRGCPFGEVDRAGDS